VAIILAGAASSTRLKVSTLRHTFNCTQFRSCPLIEHLGNLRPIVQLAIHTMLRKSELLSLRKQNVDFSGGVIRVMNSRHERTKSQRSRIVLMNPVARELLAELCSGDGEYVFVNKETGKPMMEVKTAFNNACVTAGNTGLTFHDFRRTGLPGLGKQGWTPFTLQGYLDTQT